MPMPPRRDGIPLSGEGLLTRIAPLQDSASTRAAERASTIRRVEVKRGRGATASPYRLYFALSAPH